MRKPAFVWLLAFFASFAAGILQLALSAHLNLSGVHKIAVGESTKLWIGYFETYHWSVSYLLPAPMLVASGSYTIAILWRRTRGRGQERLLLFLLIVAALLASALLVGADMLRAIQTQIDETFSYLQWNYLRAPRPDDIHPRALRVLFTLGYLHYFVAYTLGVSSALLVLVFSFRFRPLRPGPAIDKTSIQELLLAHKIAVIGYLMYLVVLRSSKAWLSIVAQNEALEVASPFELHKSIKVYWESVEAGVLRNLTLGVIWWLTSIVAHFNLITVLAKKQYTYTMRDCLARVAAALRLTGEAFTATCGWSLVFVVWTLPGPLLFVWVAGLVAVVTIKSKKPAEKSLEPLELAFGRFSCCLGDHSHHGGHVPGNSAHALAARA